MRIYNFDYAKGVSFLSKSNICLVNNIWCDPEPIHGHDYYELLYVYDGTGIQIINGEAYSSPKGSLMLFEKNDFHSFYATDNNYKMMNICFTDKINFSFVPHKDRVSFSVLPSELIEETEALIKIIEIELSYDRYGSERIITECINVLLTNLIRSSDTQPYLEHIWGPLISYVLENHATVTLNDATKIMNLSTSHFCRKFKQQFGVSFLTYVNQIRIQYAKPLLDNTDLTVAEIAERVGYGANVCRLHEDFKRFVHMTPNQYKAIRYSSKLENQ